MRNLFVPACCLLISLVFLPVVFAAPPVVGVLELDTGAGIHPDQARPLTDLLQENLHASGQFTVVERNKLEQVLEEIGLQMAGCTTTECAVETGRMLGAQQMVAGSVSRFGGLYVVSVRLIDVETGVVLRANSVKCRCAPDDFAIKGMHDAAMELMAVHERAFDAPMVEQAVSQHQRVLNLLAEADKRRRAGHIADPPHDSAITLYLKVLTLAPDNLEAENRLRIIATEYSRQGTEAETDGQWEAAVSAYEIAVRTGFSPGETEQKLDRAYMQLAETP